MANMENISLFGVLELSKIGNLKKIVLNLIFEKYIKVTLNRKVYTAR